MVPNLLQCILSHRKRLSQISTLHILGRSLCVFQVMEYVEGRDLHEVWPSLSIWGRFSGLGALWGRSTAPKGQASTPGYLWTLERHGSPLCKGHHFPERTAGHHEFPSYTALLGMTRMAGVV
jgi:hypothetical protein